MVRVISQETFDAVVKENVQDLDMTREEAVKDAKEQFEAQGVNLSNIVVSEDGQKLIEVLDALKQNGFDDQNVKFVAKVCATG